MFKSDQPLISAYLLLKKQPTAQQHMRYGKSLTDSESDTKSRNPEVPFGIVTETGHPISGGGRGGL
jgi:hypothetical protein